MSEGRATTAPAPRRNRDDAPQRGRLQRAPALDGLRGLAIAVVALFHYPTRSVFKGGLFGVGLFFVLSGFLVTTLLLGEHERYGHIRIGRFLRRRAWRLLPALVVFLVLMVVAAAAFGHHGWFESDPFRPQGPGAPLSMGRVFKGCFAALTYTYNFFLARDMTVPAPFGHLWTLAIEGQFYVLWAFLVSRLLKFRANLLLPVTVALIGVSALSPIVLWHHGAGQNTIYFGTLTNLQQILAGSLLAQLWHRELLQSIPAWVLRVAAAAAGGVLVWMVLSVANVPFKYLGALTVVSAASAIVIAHLLDHRSEGVAKGALSQGPLVWLGQRSYAVYLWHWPLAEWTNQLPRLIGVPLAVSSTLIAAELSWRLAERPAQRLSQARETRRSSSSGRGTMAPCPMARAT